MTEPLHNLVRTQIEDMVGDQIRGAVADGVRIGMQQSADVITQALQIGSFSAEQAAALTGIRDAILHVIPETVKKLSAPPAGGSGHNNGDQP